MHSPVHPVVCASLAIALVAAGCKKDSPAPSGEANSAAATPAPAPTASPAPLPEGIQALRDGDAAFMRGDLASAIEKAQAAGKAMPQNPVALNLLGRALARRFDTTKDPTDAFQAREAFKKAVAVNPGFWPALQNLGDLEEKAGLLKEAAEAYRQVLKAQPAHPEKPRYEAVIAKAEQVKPPAARKGKSPPVH